MAGILGCKFVVAVTGHTSLKDETRVRGLVDRALGEIKPAANEAMKARWARMRARSNKPAHGGPHEAPAVRMYVSSCLAAGADQLVANAGFDAGYTLQSILPGNPDEYRQSIRFKDDPERQERCRNMFDTLLAKSRGNITNLALPLPQEPEPENDAVRRRAYDAATKYMLRRCDLLIAIVDVLNKKNLGASGEAVRYAIRAGIPILWIDPSNPEELQWLSHLTEKQFDAICSDEPGERVVVPIQPHDLDDSKHTKHKQTAPAEKDWFVSETLARKVAWVIESKVQACELRREQHPSLRPWPPRAGAALWDFLIQKSLPKNITLEPTDPDAHEPVVARYFAGFWALLQFLWRFVVRFAVWVVHLAKKLLVALGLLAKPDKPPKPQDCKPLGCVIREVEIAREHSKDLARFYAGAHRSSFLVMTLLGLGAVAVGSVPTSSEPQPPVQQIPATTHQGVPARPETVQRAEAPSLHAHHPSAADRILAAVEFFIICMMIAVYYCNRHFKWQEKSIDYRLLAERLRHSAPLLLAGIDPLDTAVLPIQYSSHQAHKSWVNPFFRSVMNRVDNRILHTLGAQALPSSLLDNWTASEDFIEQSCDYIKKKWIIDQINYQRKTAANYEQLHLMFEFIQVTMLFVTIGICISHFFLHFGLLSFLEAVSPAVSAAAGSLALQAELVRLRDRSVSMAHALEHRRLLLDALRPSLDRKLLGRFVEETAEQMLSEVSEWRVLFKFRPINSPA